MQFNDEGFDNFINHVRGLPTPSFTTNDERNEYIRQQIEMIHTPKRKQDIKIAEENIFLAVIPLVPSAIILFVPSHVPKEEVIGETFKILRSCIVHYDPDNLNAATGQSVGFITYYLESLKKRFKDRRVREDVSVPFHIPDHIAPAVQLILSTRNKLYKQLRHEPTAEEVYEYILGQIPYKITQSRFYIIWNIYIERPYVDIDTNVHGIRTDETLELYDISYADIIADPGQNTEQGVLYLIDKKIFDGIIKQARLSDEQFRVIDLTFGLTGKEYTRSEIAEMMHVPEKKVEKYERSAMKKLRHPDVARKFLEILDTLLNR